MHISKISTRPELVGGLEASKHQVSTEDYPYMVVTRGARTKQESEVPKQARRRGQNSQAQNVSHTNMGPKINTNRKLRVRVEDNADQSQQTNRRSEKPTSESESNFRRNPIRMREHEKPKIHDIRRYY